MDRLESMVQHRGAEHDRERRWWVVSPLQQLERQRRHVLYRRREKQVKATAFANKVVPTPGWFRMSLLCAGITLALRRAPLLLLGCLFLHVANADEPFLKPNDVIAFVGGEDMVAASEYGYLELLLTRARPEHKLKFRCLAWDGDTVFEQRRDLNYPTLEQQLEKIGATVVIAQFGQMESLAGKEKLPEFIAAYEKLVERLSGGAKRRMVVLAPNGFPPKRIAPIPMPGLPYAPITELGEKGETLLEYGGAIRAAAGRRQLSVLDPAGEQNLRLAFATRDGIHLGDDAHGFIATAVAKALAGDAIERDLDRAFAGVSAKPMKDDDFDTPRFRLEKRAAELTLEKNRLWFHYYRPQNWAFLAGDRTNQPSSRDHLDPKKRWFPEELEQFLPLIEQKEIEIWKMAAELAKAK